jgi:hypothetical protein
MYHLTRGWPPVIQLAKKVLFGALLMVLTLTGLLWLNSAQCFFRVCSQTLNSKNTRGGKAVVPVTLRYIESDKEIAGASGNPAGYIYEWNFNIPAEFRPRIIDNPSIPTDRSMMKDAHVAILSFEAILDEKLERLLPHPGSSEKRKEEMQFSFSLFSEPGNRGPSAVDTCLTADESYKASRLQNTCDDFSPNCSVRTNFHGWRVRLSLDKRLYAKADEYCDFAQHQLEQWTIKFDPIPEAFKQ